MDLQTLFLSLGSILLVGLLTDEVGRRSRLPRVTLLILIGVAVGPSGFDILPSSFQDWYEFLANTALTMVAFLLGGRLSRGALKKYGKMILAVSVTAVTLTAMIIWAGLFLAGTPLILSLMLAGIGTATAPAASQDIVRQSRAKGPFTDTLLGVVALDDALGLVVFSLLLVIAKASVGDGSAAILLYAGRELGGALLIGAAIGFPAAFLTGRLRPGEPMQLEALGLVFLCAGLAQQFGVSLLLTGMIAGSIIANFARHHERPFHEIENVEWPFMVFFFLLAGASLELNSIQEIGIVGLVYILLRSCGRIAGGWLGCALAQSDKKHRRWMGLALMPQAGVAIGMALVATEHFPQIGDSILAITIGTTVVFEIVGPMLTQLALRRVGEAR